MDTFEIENFYSRYYSELVKYAQNLGGIDYHTAEDLTQDLFVSIQLKNLHFKDEHFLNYCKLWLKHKILDYLRTEQYKARSIYKIRFLHTLHEYDKNEIDQLIDRIYIEHILREKKPNRRVIKIINTYFNPSIDLNTKSAGKDLVVVSPINHQVLEFLADNPLNLYNLSDSEFERVMSEIYQMLGYDVTRTPATKDGGKDIILCSKSALGEFIYYVECKKYSSKRTVGVGIIRNLYGVTCADKVNGGIVTTTSHFSRDAVEFIEKHNLQHQIKLQDFETIKYLLNIVTKKHT